MKMPTPWLVLFTLLLAPFAQAQTAAPAEPTRPPEPALTEPPAAVVPEAPSASTPEEKPAGEPPSALAFAGRMALVTLAAGLGEIPLGWAGLTIGWPLGGLNGAFVGATVGTTLGAALGASLVGALIPGNHWQATVGAFLGAAVGGLVMTRLSTSGPGVLVLPGVGAALGYAIGFLLAPPASPTTTRNGGGIQISPVVSLAQRGGGHVGLAGVF